MAEKRWFLVTYDVREAQRLRRVGRTVCGFGERIQYSVFRCRLTEREIERLRWALSKVMAEEDDLLVIGLCPTCAAGIKRRGGVEWPDDEPPFEIL